MTPEENERLTRVGPGTPMGALFRRYWLPVGSVDEMERHPTRSVRLLGESFVLYRDARGRPGLVGERCPHRGASLRYAVPQEDGLRCAYHGWRFDRAGRCTEMPGQRDGYAALRDVRVPSHPVEALGGMLFAYLGPEPAPPLPRWDLFLERGFPKEIASVDVPCNWLQVMENNLDDHVRWLHVGFHEFAARQSGVAPTRTPPAVAPGEWPGVARRDADRPAPGTETPWGFHASLPVLLPSALMTGQGRLPCLQIRVPLDDVHTRQWFYTVYEIERSTIDVLRPHHDAASLDGTRVPHQRVPTPLAVDEVVDYAAMSDNVAQDAILVASQGAIHDRTREILGAKDASIAFYRNVLRREMATVERGEDPLGTFRDLAPDAVLATPRLPPFAATELRGLRARPGERPLENVQARSPLLARLLEAGVDVNALKFQSAGRPSAPVAP
jgi:5,5'-dehydrodivanillate O-demethylase